MVTTLFQYEPSRHEITSGRFEFYFLKQYIKKRGLDVLAIFTLLLFYILKFVIFRLMISNWASLIYFFKWTILLCFLERKHIFKECCIPWFHYSIRMNVKKSICINIVSISDKNIIHSFTCYLDIFKI